MAAPPWPSLLILGPTGSGKSPLGREIERRGFHGRRSVHFDFGAELRSIAAGSGTAAGMTAGEIVAIRASLASGALFEDRDLPMVVRIIADFAAARNIGPGDLVVLNGLPRHAGQAEGLAGIIAVEAVVELAADAAVIRERMRVDPDGDRSGREDDSPETIERRLADYRTRTFPLAGHYRRLGVPVRVITVSASMTAAEMYGRLASMIGEGADNSG